MNAAECEVVIGTVTGAYGIQGEVKVQPEPDSIERFRDLSEVCVRHEGRQWIAHVERARRHGKLIVLALAEVTTVPAARRLAGALLAIPPTARRELPAGEYFVDDLLGMEVYTPDGRRLGQVDDVLQLPANDVFVVGDYLYPAIHDYVLEIDLPGRRIVVRPPEESFEE
ncbi:MAG: 16S rRNA processing protein RimM [Armatimonadetes bacterium]|jgi:16S rRNA processing protein RimM|nr:16S rRNA processing protein RimM [Armatimonadota bacterium]